MWRPCSAGADETKGSTPPSSSLSLAELGSNEVQILKSIFQVSALLTFPPYVWAKIYELPSSSHFQSRLVTLVWCIWGELWIIFILPHRTPPSKHPVTVRITRGRCSGMKWCRKTETDREGDWNGEKRRVGVSYLQRPCSRVCSFFVFFHYVAPRDALQTRNTAIWEWDSTISYLSDVFTNSSGKSYWFHL